MAKEIKLVNAIINGQTVPLTYNGETGLYEATCTAPQASSYPLEGGYYPVQITAEDNAGNSTTVSDKTETVGENCRLFVKERIKPTATITYPTNDAFIITNTPKIEFTILDNSNGQATGFSGIDKSRTVLKINGQPVNVSDITFSEIAGGYKGSYTLGTALDDGNVTVEVTTTDFDGNVSAPASCSFKVDTVAPTLSVTAPVQGTATNKGTLTVAGKTNDVTSSPVTVHIFLNEADQGEVTVNSDGSFSKDITLTQLGENVIKVVATDRAGRTTEVSRTIEYNTVAPIISNVVMTPNPVDHNKTFKISCRVE